MGLRANLLAVILSDLPSSDSILTEPDPRWDERLGGRTGPDSWGWYSRTYGTTCIVTTNGWLVAAGAPDDMVVREPTPNGGGTKMLQAQIRGAEARGWLHTPTRGQLPDFRSGDVYNINHVATDRATGAPIDGTHEGVIVSVTPSADGQSLIVETADGGQGPWTKQQASRQVRTFSLSNGPHPVVVKSQYSSGWLDRWISIGGDDDVDVTPPDVPETPLADGAPDEGGRSSAILGGALIATGAMIVTLAVVGLGSRPPPPPPPSFYA